jgi:hypothetical protein
MSGYKGYHTAFTLSMQIEGEHVGDKPGGMTAADQLAIPAIDLDDDRPSIFKNEKARLRELARAALRAVHR